MPSINISERDYELVAGAAMDAEQKGHREEAEGLDKIARKINAALTAVTTRPYSWLSGSERKPLTWQDMPSTLGKMP